MAGKAILTIEDMGVWELKNAKVAQIIADTQSDGQAELWP